MRLSYAQSNLTFRVSLSFSLSTLALASCSLADSCCFATVVAPGASFAAEPPSPPAVVTAEATFLAPPLSRSRISPSPALAEPLVLSPLPLAAFEDAAMGGCFTWSCWFELRLDSLFDSSLVSLVLVGPPGLAPLAAPLSRGPPPPPPDAPLLCLSLPPEALGLVGNEGTSLSFLRGADECVWLPVLRWSFFLPAKEGDDVEEGAAAPPPEAREGLEDFSRSWSWSRSSSSDIAFHRACTRKQRARYKR